LGETSSEKHSIIALIDRLIAVIFSQGYGFHDDHFLVIEASEAWAKGYDWNNWSLYIKEIKPGNIDLLMRKISPSNNNQSVFIY
jgi:hypothetical protein